MPRPMLTRLWNEFAEVDENGVSRIVLATEIAEQYRQNTRYSKLYWIKEGPTRHRAFRGMCQLNWEFERNSNRSILSIQSTGINQDYARAELLANRPIRPDIRKSHTEKFNYCTLCCESFEILDGKIVIDHKDDSYSDPRVCGKAAVETQKKEDFQIVCEGCNRRKDLMKQTYPEWRPPPGHYKEMGYGNYFIDDKGVKREYWYDGEAYRKYWKNGFSDEELAHQLESCTSLKIETEPYTNEKSNADSNLEEEEKEQVADAIQMTIQTNHCELNIGQATDEELAHGLGSYTLANKPSNKKI